MKLFQHGRESTRLLGPKFNNINVWRTDGRTNRPAVNRVLRGREGGGTASVNTIKQTVGTVEEGEKQQYIMGEIKRKGLPNAHL